MRHPAVPKTALAARASLHPFPVTVLRFAFFSSLYLPKTAFATLANLPSEDLTL
jgi:hypothetical protein